jgi:HD-GYP domain-containing protein (c-di-GMP phosphodiesterase class II)
MNRRLTVSDIRLMHPLPWDVYDTRGQLLLHKGYLIQTKEQLLSLIERGLFTSQTSETKAEPPPPPPQQLDAFAIYSQLELQLNRCLRYDDPAGFQQAIQQVRAKVDSMSEHHFDTSFAHMMLGYAKSYSVAHHMHVATLVAALLPKLESIIPQKDWGSIVNAALTMNIGMLLLQEKLLHHKGKLNAEQQKLVHAHPEGSVKQLMKLGVRDEVWLKTVLQHHEREDGSGYPHGIKEVYAGAELIALADVFCVKVSDRGYRKAMTAKQAAQDLFKKDGAGKVGSIASLIIKEVGVYPPGSYVKLANGETAIVIRRGPTALTPIVATLITPEGSYRSEPAQRDTSRPDFTIKSVISKHNIPLNLNPAKLWQLK